MYSLKYNVKVGEHRLIELPEDVYELLGLRPGDIMHLRYNSQGIFLAPPKPSCVLCGARHSLYPFGRWHLCAQCVKWVRNTQLKSEKKSRPE